MHELLHLRAQTPHETQRSVSIRMRSSDARDTSPKSVPTGQNELQYARPPRHAEMTTMTSIISAMAALTHDTETVSRANESPATAARKLL